ncbi:MAG TPA: glycerophosphodiester phosphodiesterase family protein [Myxococcales bacterium]|nr:glycerophosphodiester phosphodiesterase family protein [Myxococcales bacterium]
MRIVSPVFGIRVYAHRGASRELPENTMPAFRRAIELGADALETDVHATADGVLVAAHDPDGARVFGVHRRIADCRWDEVRAWGAASLEEVVLAFPGVPINVDLKVPVAALAVELLHRLGEAGRVTLASFQSSTLRQVRALGYRGPTSLGRSEVARLVSLPAAAQRGPLAPPGVAAQLPLKLARPWVIRRCHALGLRVDYWTVNEPALARSLAALGADGIMTDDPAAIVLALRGA